MAGSQPSSAIRIGATTEMFTRSIYKIRAQVKKKRIMVNRRGQPVGRATVIAPSSVAIVAPFHDKGPTALITEPTVASTLNLSVLGKRKAFMLRLRSRYAQHERGLFALFLLRSS